ncbi:hypothetical protein [Pseudochelatococcus contaminans]|uniref:Uncharacterized protein n=1 Tax=Pseudochelatococcus contaminans TaxID=1538103 RepID=A0A7W5Z3M2_9HYPH|nr:hypothetical protein [Pseudochelatococcus contaminans]MBB3809428.1 hypothetical protein [Pseudochelatococcus contaminans]
MTGRPLFVPSPKAGNVLIAIGLCALGWGLYVRFMLVEASNVGLACQAGLPSAGCQVRAITVALFDNNVFGAVALGAAVLHLIRPHVVLLGIALLAAGAGIVLYNTALSAFALALLMLAFARPAPVSDLQPE